MADFFKVSNLSFGYDKQRKILSDINFSVEQGEIVGLIGLNGSGKSTLLKCALNELKYDGQIELDGVKLKEAKSKELAKLIGYIPQSDGIDISLSVLDVVLMGFYDLIPLFASPSKEQKNVAMCTLEKIGMKDFADRDYLSLSGGEKQLCLLARTLLRQCPLLILDEPDSSLDAKNKLSVLNTLKAQCREQNRSVLLAVHDLTFALNYCDRLLLLNGGKISADFKPHEMAPESIKNILSGVYGKIEIEKIGTDKNYLVAVLADM
jgi:iron complex transport system ATP-binding protein